MFIPATGMPPYSVPRFPAGMFTPELSAVLGHHLLWYLLLFRRLDTQTFKKLIEISFRSVEQDIF